MISLEGVRLRHSRELLNLLLTGGLFVAPWALGFAGQAVAAWTAWVTGVVGGMLSVMAAFAASAEEPDTVSLVLGVWTTGAPWILGFGSVIHAVWAFVAVGVVLVVIATWEVRTDMPDAPVTT